jgi:DNA-binding transcriptional regulator LsrR (DeoR family)
MKHIPATSEPDRRVVNAATMWHERRNSAEIARALKIPEPEALKLLEKAREEALLP